MSDDWGARAIHMQELADPVARQALEAMMGQLLIVLVERLGGEVTVPVAEIDGTGDRTLNLRFDQEERTFTFVNRRKS